MMDKERVAPNLFCYQVVIGICARNGYLTQAFDLYREVIFFSNYFYVSMHKYVFDLDERSWIYNSGFSKND